MDCVSEILGVGGVLGSLSVLQGEGCPLLQQSKIAAVYGPASDCVEATREGLAINHICGGGAKRRTTGGDEEAIPELPWAAAQHARAVLTDVFKPGALRITRFPK